MTMVGSWALVEVGTKSLVDRKVVHAYCLTVYMEPFYGPANQSDPHTVSQRWYNELEPIYFHATEAQLEAHRLNTPKERLHAERVCHLT
jgi:hypothetical protein